MLGQCTCFRHEFLYVTGGFAQWSDMVKNMVTMFTGGHIGAFFYQHSRTTKILLFTLKSSNNYRNNIACTIENHVMNKS